MQLLFFILFQEAPLYFFFTFTIIKIEAISPTNKTARENATKLNNAMIPLMRNVAQIKSIPFCKRFSVFGLFGFLDICLVVVQYQFGISIMNCNCKCKEQSCCQKHDNRINKHFHRSFKYSFIGILNILTHLLYHTAKIKSTKIQTRFNINQIIR